MLLLSLPLACEPPQGNQRAGETRDPAGSSAAEGGGNAQEPPSELARGQLVRSDEREEPIAAGEAHRYEILLEAGEYLHVEVEQRGVDLALVLNLDESEIGRFDSPNGAYGSEHLWALAPGEGTHSFKLLASRGTGSYAIRQVGRRPPTAEDRIALAAWKAYTEGQWRQRSHPREALEHYREAQALWQELNDPVRQAMAGLRIGQVQHNLRERRQAIESFREALEYLRDQGQTSQEVVTLQKLGHTLRRNAEYSAALAAFEDALRRIRRVGDRYEEAHALNNVALALDLQGRMGQALGMYQEALDAFQETDAEPKWRARTLSNMAFSHILTGQLPEARRALLKALELHQQAGDGRGVALVRAQLGWIAYREGDVTAALDGYDRAIELSRRIEQDSTARRIEAGALDRKGTAFRELGRLAEARAAYTQARQIFEDLGDALFVAHVDTNIGWLDLHDGETERAWTRFELARERFEPSRGQHDQAYVLYLGASIERRRGRLAEARAFLEQVLEIVESNRRVSQNPKMRISYIGARYDYYESYVDLLMDLHQQEPAAGHATTALAAVERNRARSLLEHLTKAGADFRRGVDEDLLAEQTALQDQINAKELELTEKRSPEVERQLGHLLQRYRRVQDDIREANPVYAELTQPKPLGVEAIQQQLLDDESLLLVYSLGRERSFLWTVSTSSMTVHVLDEAAGIEKMAVRLHRRLSKSYASGARLQAELTAAELSKKLLGPIASRLGSRRLLIMPDKALHLVPFAALPRPEPDGTAAGPPLVAEHEIVYVPSASAIAALRREVVDRPAAEGFMAVLADPAYSEDGDFERLISSRLEGKQVLALVPEGEITLEAFGFAARRELVTSGRLAAFRYLHFATHGTFDVAHPERSGLVLSTVDEEGQAIDGMIPAHELYQLRFSAQLAVLSGCKTALGPMVRGEGILGLSRGFMYAGTPRVVVSLWNVSDEGTAELMKRFYDAHLRRGIRPSEALREAQRSMLGEARWQAPYYWAAFVFQGDWS